MIGTGWVKHADRFRKTPPLKREQKNAEKRMSSKAKRRIPVAPT